MNNVKRFLSLALALVLMLTCIPATVLAADPATALPTATVSKINKDDLTFAMNFKVNPVTEEQLNLYGSWYADFELTINKDTVFNNDGSADGWLAGQYDAWSENWVTVPFGKFAPVTVKANEPIKIMAFAAELMGEPGLKYTYKEVYEGVKDFDCGVYFDDEFLAANPDLEVTLELKMYNPANESESYIIGETYIYMNPTVAQNTTTGKVYSTVNAAMMDCAAGQTVILMKDSAEQMVAVFADATLDLNGHTLAAGYVTCFGDIIDSSDANSGVLAVATDRLMIREDNAQIPVHNGTGYQFVEVLAINTAMKNAYTFAFQPRFEPGMLELLKQGTDVTGITIQVQVSWKEEQGYRTQNFVYNDSLLMDYLSSYKPASDSYSRMFTLTLQGAEDLEELTFVAVAVSNTKVTASSANLTPGKPAGNVTTDANNQVVNDVTIGSGNASALVPSGTQLENGANNVTLNATEMEKTTSNITVGDGEKLVSMNVHVDGVAANNTKPIIVTLTDLAPEALNQGNLALYHVENGETVEMTRVYSINEVDEHNEYYYDIATGTITMALATFSEIAVVSEKAAWEGDMDTNWYDASKTYFEIYNADQLFGLSAIVGGMNGLTQDSFAGKAIKLMADIDLNDAEKANNSWIFYPIGYYNSDGTYGKTNTAITSGFKTFEGTFDGNGHTISNFYQNTWEMKGDHEWYDATLQYYRDGMGLFGRVYGGTVKNLTIANFSSDGEITTTGCVAAYADFGATFENIAIKNCNPRVYNIGNGGIVGCVGWYTKGETNKKVTFKNITVDNTNKISALWGSYDVACGGIVGQYYPTSGQTSAGTPKNAGIDLINCHVAAQMDVYNDVCANYQYYAYRYAGMLIGSVRENVTIDGHSYPKMDGITASGCTVHFGDWNDYYYCELVANSLASYTHDHQMSRLEQVASVDVEKMQITTLKGETVAIPTSGRVNYVVVTAKNADGTWKHGDGHEYATCYHFVDGAVWNHEDAGTETVGGVEGVLKEDKQLIYREFDQLVTGYGWGVTSKGIGDFDGVTILDREVADSVEKFEPVVSEGHIIPTFSTIKIGDLFKDNGQTEVAIDQSKVQVFVSPADETSSVVGTYTAGAGDWTNGTLYFTGVGFATITITDYYFCEPTTVTVKIGKAIPEYTVPTGLTATYGDKLSSIVLPNNFSWETPNATVGNAGNNNFNAIFTPDNTELYQEVKVSVTVTVAKATPPVTVPTDLTAKYNQTLATVGLPEGFSWQNPYTVLTVTGTYPATYTPTDTENYNTVPVDVPVEVIREPVEKFESKFTGDFLYRVGNLNTVKLNNLFTGIDATGTVSVTIDNVKGNASGVYTSNATWTNGTIQFSGTGVVKVTIKDDDQYCTPTVLYLEVVDAENVTSAISATNKNIVLLDNASASSLTVSNGYTFYGNGFTLNFTGDGSYKSAAVSYGFVTLENGTLDNVQIKCRIFPESYIYTKEMAAGSDGRYPYGYSAVVVTGNSVISNCYIYGARNNIQVGTGNVTIEDTVLACGSLSNIHCKGTNADTVTLHNVTTIQYQIKDDFNVGNTVLGFGVLVGTNESASNPVIKLTGDFKQYNWVTSDDAAKVSNSYAATAISSALEQSNYHYTFNDVIAVNMGIVILNALECDIIDERINESTILYSTPQEISINGYTGQVASILKGSEGISTESRYDATTDKVLPYVPKKNNVVSPSVSYGNTNNSITLETKFETETGKWQTTLSVDLDSITGGSFTFNFSDLFVQKYGTNLSFTIKDANGSVIGNNTTLTLNQLFTGEYTLVAVDNLIYNKQGQLTDQEVTHEIPFIVKATKTSIDPPKFTNAGTATAIRLVTSKGGDWRPAYTVLTGITVTYWSASEGKVKTVDLSTLYNSGTISSNVWTYTCDDYTLTITGGAVHSDGTTITPVIANNTLYFASTNKAFGTGTTSRNIILTYVFTDKNDSTTWNRTETVQYSNLSEYDYNSFKDDGKLSEPSSGGCVTPDTLITLADGTQVRVDELTGNEMLLVWNLETGKLDSAPIMFTDHDAAAELNVVHLYFSDGSEVKVIYEHGFWDYNLNKYVYLDESAADYIGHWFAKQNGSELAKVQLVDVAIEKTVTEAYSPVTAGHLCYFVNGMLSMPGGVGGLFNIFDVDAETMTYDYEAMLRDIETYGLFTYEEMNAIVPLPEEMFIAAGGAYLKVSIGKGNMTMDDLVYMIERYTKFFPA